MNVERPLEPKKRAIVVGASSGMSAQPWCGIWLNKAISWRLLARREAKLQELCEQVNVAVENGRAIPYTHNVTDSDTIPSLFQTIVHDLGGLDIIIYVAGVQPAVALNEYSFEKDQAMININVLGAIAWLNEAAVRFERAGSKGANRGHRLHRW